jgi:RNA polymerase sigma-70 factor (ECF subfamily)
MGEAWAEVPSAALLERARAGDVAALRQLFAAHAPAVRRFLHDLVGDSHAAEDGTRETLVWAHRRLGTLRRQRPLPWLLAIAFQLRLGLPHAPPSPWWTGGSELERRLAKALQRLPERPRAALLLRSDHRLDYEEIGGVLDLSSVVAEAEVRHARLELRRLSLTS